MSLRRRLFGCLAVVAVVGAVGALAALYYLPGYVARRAIDEARARGVRLTLSSVELEWGEVRLFDVVARPDGVEGATGRADVVAVMVSGFAPERIVIERLSGSLEGVEVFGELAGWMSKNAAASAAGTAPMEIPVEIRGVEITWRERGATHDAIVVTGDAFELRPADGRFLGAVARLGERRYGPVDIAWETTDDGIDLLFGATEREAATVLAALRPGRAEARLVPTRLGAIADFFSVELPRPDLVVAGDVEMELADGDDGAAVLVGHARADLDGFVPPHPRELDGILFGDETRVELDVAVSPDREQVALGSLVVEAGALRLKGSGEVATGLDESIATLDLEGSVACKLLTASAVAAHLGPGAGKIAGQLAQRALSGSVAVRLRVKASSRSFDEPEVEPSAVIGCSLNLLQLPKLPKLPKPKIFGKPL